MHCTNIDENNNEMDGVEVINLCSVSQSKNNAFVEGKESTKQESQDKLKHDAAEKWKWNQGPEGENPRPKTKRSNPR